MRKSIFTALLLLAMGGLIAVIVHKPSWTKVVVNDISKISNVAIAGTSQIDGGGSSGNQLLYITLRTRHLSGEITIFEKSVVASLIRNHWNMSTHRVLDKDNIGLEVWTCEYVRDLVASNDTITLYVPTSVIKFCSSTEGLIVRAGQI